MSFGGGATVEIGGSTFDLEPKDVVAVPGWARYRIDNATRSRSEDTVVFAYSNRPPALRALNLLRDEPPLSD